MTSTSPTDIASDATDTRRDQLVARTRQLPLWVEIVRQFRRRRTKVAIGVIVAIPLLLLAALEIGGPPGSGGVSANGQPVFLASLATQGGFDFALFALFITTQFLSVVVVCLFAGDSVASEASWGSLRYLLAQPIPRWRLLQQKLTVALLYGVLTDVLLPLVALVAGTIAYGWHGIVTTTGQDIASGASLRALVIITAYITFTLVKYACAAFLCSILTDAPLGAVGGAVGFVLVSNILDAVTSLGVIRECLPTHYDLSWIDVLQRPPVYGNMERGLLVSVIYTLVFIGLAWWRFRRKDITS